MILIIGNPTNIYLATNAGASFASYTLKMALPTIAAGVVSLIVLFLIFRTRLTQPIKTSGIKEKIKDKPAVAIGLVHLGGSLIFMVISSYIKLPMWIISLGFCVSLFVTSTVYFIMKRKGFSVIGETLKRTPVETIPFVLSMFVIVLALQNSGITEMIATTLSKGNAVLTFGATSFFAANLINNIPMSVLYSSITSFADTASYNQALYASVIGSNLGAFFTPLGALAGIMWTNMLKGSNVRMNFARFTKYGTAVALPTLAASLLTLAIV
jgi:arsenical pump membrane protein